MYVQGASPKTSATFLSIGFLLPDHQLGRMFILFSMFLRKKNLAGVYTRVLRSSKKLSSPSDMDSLATAIGIATIANSMAFFRAAKNLFKEVGVKVENEDVVLCESLLFFTAVAVKYLHSKSMSSSLSMQAYGFVISPAQAHLYGANVDLGPLSFGAERITEYRKESGDEAFLNVLMACSQSSSVMKDYSSSLAFELYKPLFVHAIHHFAPVVVECVDNAILAYLRTRKT